MRESKNQWVVKCISNLVAKRKLRLAGMLFLCKSHTHTRSYRSAVGYFSSAHCEPRFYGIDSQSERQGIRAWMGTDTQLNVQKKDATRNWRDNWLAQGITLEGGLLEDATANHVFMMMVQSLAGFHHAQPSHSQRAFRFSNDFQFRKFGVSRWVSGVCILYTIIQGL